MMVLFGLSVFTQNNAQITANEAVQTALMASRNDDARMTRGVFAIDREKFKQNLANSNVATWRGRLYNQHSDGKNSGMDKMTKQNVLIKVLFIPDTSLEASKFNNNDNKENKNDMAIKAVKVIVFNKAKTIDDHYQTLDAINFTISSKLNKKIPKDFTDDRYNTDPHYLYDY